jgi:hypothetical protein
MIRSSSAFVAVTALVGCASVSLTTPPPNAEPSKFSYTRIHCTPDNESHFEAVTTDLARVDAAPPAMPFFARGSAATRVAFAAFEPGWGSQDEKAKKYHPAPAAQYVVYLSGEMSISTSDGQTRRFRTGDVLRVEDVAPCKGHISVVGSTAVHTMVVR